MSAWPRAAVSRLRFALAQARADAGRMAASALAIAIGAAFVVVAFGITATSKRAVLDSVARQYSSSAVLVGTRSGSPAAPDALREALTRLRSGKLDGAAVLDLSGIVNTAPVGQAPETGTSIRLNSISPAGPLRWERVLSGRLPTRTGEVAVSGPSDLSVGDVVGTQAVAYGDVSGRPAAPTYPLRVVGVVDIGGYPSSGTGTHLYATAPQAELLGATPEQLRLAAAPGTSRAATLDRARRLLSAGPRTAVLSVKSGEQGAQEVTDNYTGNTAGVTAALMIFVALALLVAAMVIANTFAVVLAQRVRELGLLRCVGATTKQLRRSTLAEAGVLGAVSSTLGALLGAGLTALVAALLGRTVSEMPLGTPVIPTYALVTAVLGGTATTLGAALLPIRAATRVRPLAALHPLESVAGAGTSRRRLLVLGAVSLVSLAGLLEATVMNQPAIAVLTGVINFCVLTLLVRGGASSLIALVGRLLSRPGGIAARLATENIRRYPRRTGASVVILLLGVTLISSVLVGVASARATANRGLGDAYPFDVTVTAGPSAFPGDIRERLHHVHGVDATTALTSARLRVDGHAIDAVGIDLATVSQVSRTDQTADLPSPGHVAMSYETADQLKATDGTTLRLSGDKSNRELTVSIAQVPGLAPGTIALDQPDLDALSSRSSIRQLWVRLSDDSNSRRTQVEVSAIARAAASVSHGAEVHADVSTRDALDSIMSFMLTVVLGLLAVTIVIASLGLGNTLALSAMERSRESATMRALGSTRRQLAATILWEAIQISVITAALGCILGIVYGLIGVRAVLYDLRVVIPWSQLTVLGGVAILAGMLAALIPAWKTTGGTLMARIAAQD